MDLSGPDLGIPLNHSFFLRIFHEININKPSNARSGVPPWLWNPCPEAVADPAVPERGSERNEGRGGGGAVVILDGFMGVHPK